MNHYINSDSVTWVQRMLGDEYQSDTARLDTVLYFSLIWNLFEGILCEENATIGKFEDIADRLRDKGSLRIEDFDRFLSWSKKKYVVGDAANELFDALCFRRNDKKDFVEQVLISENADVRNLIVALLIITYRFRNNLFHGIKSFKGLIRQSSDFEIINQFLIKIMEMNGVI